MMPLIVSFYSAKTPHQEEARRLRDSCEHLHIEAQIEEVSSCGCLGLKPFFILNQLKQQRRPVLWVDCTAAFVQRPDFKEFEFCDLAVRINEFLPKEHAMRVVSNALFVRNNPAGIAVIEEWCKEVGKGDRDKELGEEAALSDVLQKTESLRFHCMPLKYSKIFDYDDLFIAEQEVVIAYSQTSFCNKNRIQDLCQNHCCH